MKILTPKGFSRIVFLGSGSFSRVFRAHQKSLDRTVVLKAIECPDRSTLHELLNEARHLAQLSLSSVPQIYDAFLWRKRVWLVMEWIGGITLAEVIDEGVAGRVEHRMVAALIDTVANLHRNGIAHGDLKPENILVSPDQGVYSIDLGFSSFETENRSAGFKGTPRYMAPEIVQGREAIDRPKADIYALGIILQECFPGVVPEDLLMQCLESNPAVRIPSAIDLSLLWKQHSPEKSDVHFPVKDRFAYKMAEQLYRAAHYHLGRGNDDDSYWLLSETLDFNAEHTGALELLHRYPEIVRKRKFRQQMIAVTATVSIVLITVIAIILNAPEEIVPVTNPVTSDESSGKVVRAGERAAGTLPLFREALSLPKVETTALQGRVRLLPPEQSGTLYMNGVQCSKSVLSDTGALFQFGTYRFEWRIPSGEILWSEQIDIVPFSEKQLAITPEQGERI